MEELITQSSGEFREFLGQIRAMNQSIVAIREKHRPSIANERYLTSEEVMRYLHISLRTLQNFRDNRIIAFTTIGSRILYPESKLQKLLTDNYHPSEEPY